MDMCRDPGQLEQLLLPGAPVPDDISSLGCERSTESVSSCRVSAIQRRRVEETMQKHSEGIQRLEGRIQKLGLQAEYQAFKDRYLEWRKGKAIGARGELFDQRQGDDTFGERGLLNERNLAANRGGLWYPTVSEWLWKRTMTYWIAVTFFEGSIFFCISSFLYNEQARLDSRTFEAMTVYGYVGGKICFLVCTYFMCLETVNFSPGSGEENSPAKRSPIARRRKKTDFDDRTFYYNPFRYQTAFRRLGNAGVWKLPYITALTYFVGVLLFTIGLAMEFAPAWAVPLDVGSALKRVSFIVGSVHFVAGGFVECVQNSVNITREDFTSIFGFIAACGNLVGSALFLAGSVETRTWDANFLFGIGSVVFMGASSLSIIMWKDEQFGLTFMAVLNNYRKKAGTGVKDKRDYHHHNRFSLRGCLIVQMCCWTGAISTYNFLIEIERHSGILEIRSEQMAFNEFVPCLISHMMLLLMSAVFRPPSGAPFKQLYVMLRLFCVAMTLNSSVTLWEFLWLEVEQ